MINCLATRDGGQRLSVREQRKINEGYYWSDKSEFCGNGAL